MNKKGRDGYMTKLHPRLHWHLELHLSVAFQTLHFALCTLRHTFGWAKS